MQEFSYKTREKSLQRFRQEIFDVLIIGGGITGAGTARDAASRGLKVALVEAKDFASGTSSKSSKLIHGGLRYLQNMEFGLVFEALSERAHLLKISCPSGSGSTISFLCFEPLVSIADFPKKIF
ncbi:MAG: FAD-dependent oxidoreductase [Deltaproteobacteria bacterium]|nr:FAD-dependent oxidoreductase [Deltaproteobacteria bacterium]